MGTASARLVGRWDWRRSARWRLWSLAATWVTVLGAPLLGPLLGPVVVLRLGVSGAQLALNSWLARRAPLPSRGRVDRWLLGVTFGAACVVSAVGGGAYEAPPVLLLLVLAPYSAIQLRTNARCLAAGASRG